jgi:hypothetical protein
MPQSPFPRSCKKSLSVLAALLAVAGGGRASAELWVYEGFQYEPLSLLEENIEDPTSLAKGFSGPWSGDNQVIVPEGGLTFGTLLTHGGSLWYPDDKEMSRPLDAAALPTFAGLSEIWISFLLQRNSGPTLPHENDLAALNLGYPRVGTTPAYRLSIGEQLDGEKLSFNSGPLPGQIPAEPVNNASVGLGLGETKLIVFKLSLNVDGNADLGQMFVNPTLGQSAPGVDPIAQGTTNLEKWFTTFRFTTVGDGSDLMFDEFRMGSTYADVTPTIPEPSSLLLLGMASAALIGSRCRRKAA